MEKLTRRPLWGWVLALACAIYAALLAGLWSDSARALARQDMLEDALQRHALAARALTLDGNLMGAMSLLGLIEPSLKQEGVGTLAPNSAAVQTLLADAARAYHVQSVFVVGRDGRVASSWEDSGRTSTGMDVRFRPYFKTAMLGRDNVYAAVSLARDERTLYFSAPIYADRWRAGAPVGAVVARTGLARIDALLAATGKTALLLSPQGVVFASTRSEWLGMLSGAVTAQRLREIRSQRQFGNLFQTQVPDSLPFVIGTGLTRVQGLRSAMASAPIEWNDPAGNWQLVLIEDLSQTVQAGAAVRDGAAAGAAVLVLVLLLWHVLRSQVAQRQAARQIEQMAQQQAALAERRMQLAQAALRLQQAADMRALVQTFLSECHHMFGALQGVVYLGGGDDGPLRLAGTFAGLAPPPEIALGAGLLGQCARTRQACVVDTVADGGPWTMHSGLGGCAPAALLLAPVLLQARLLGAVELALPRQPAADVLEQFTAVVDVLALNLGFARAGTGCALSCKETMCEV